MSFSLRPMVHPRSVPYGYSNYIGNMSLPPTTAQRGVPFNARQASAETSADNPPVAGPASIFAPRQMPVDQSGRLTTLADLYSMYNQYLGRNPVLGTEAGGAAEGWVNPATGERQGRVGLPFTVALNQIRGSQEAKNRIAAGVAPRNMDPFTGTENRGGASTGTLWYAKGGTIREPVFGVGMMSGKHYMMGEAGPEKVIPFRPPNRGR